MRVLVTLILMPMLASAADTTMAGLDWLEGCWVSDDGSSHEVWVVDSDGSMIGFAVSQDGGTLAFYEVLSIRRNEDRNWVYNAHPSGQAATSFLAVEITGNSALFANPEHDYPQEIRYRREGDTLYASISLKDGEKPRTFDKIACG